MRKGRNIKDERGKREMKEEEMGIERIIRDWVECKMCIYEQKRERMWEKGGWGTQYTPKVNEDFL